jgi:hypothetical protein
MEGAADIGIKEDSESKKDYTDIMQQNHFILVRSILIKEKAAKYTDV